MTPDSNMAAAEAAVTEREKALGAAVGSGRILPDSVGVYREKWKQDPSGTAALLARLEPGLPRLAGDGGADPGAGLTPEQERDIAHTFGAHRSTEPSHERDPRRPGYLDREAATVPTPEVDLRSEADLIAVSEAIVAQWFVEDGAG